MNNPNPPCPQTHPSLVGVGILPSELLCRGVSGVLLVGRAQHTAGLKPGGSVFPVCIRAPGVCAQVWLLHTGVIPTPIAQTATVCSWRQASATCAERLTRWTDTLPGDNCLIWCLGVGFCRLLRCKTTHMTLPLPPPPPPFLLKHTLSFSPFYEKNHTLTPPPLSP